MIHVSEKEMDAMMMEKAELEDELRELEKWKAKATELLKLAAAFCPDRGLNSSVLSRVNAFLE